MAILNFNFTKINVEKKSKVNKQVSIKSGLNISNVVASDVVAGKDQNAFVISFTYNVQYEPNIGIIELSGDLLYLAKEEDAKAITDQWEKSKSLPEPVALPVFNRILHSCNVEALILSRDINLPAPVQLPKVKAQAKKD
ncbi:MAG: hypothetical protein ACLFNM_02835 [Candidatus Woesearchaeota archaeon]